MAYYKGCVRSLFPAKWFAFFSRNGRGGVFANGRCKLLSLASCIVLLLVNLYVWYMGCENFQSPIHLPHGYLPVFPAHLYPSPNMTAPLSLSSLSSLSPSLSILDQQLYTNIVHNSLSRSVPPVLHIVHCDRGPFTYTHYSSVVAAFKILKPSAIFLYILQEPELDPDGYFQFLPDLLRDIPILTKVKLDHSGACFSKGSDQRHSYVDIIGSSGGIAISSRVVLVPSQQHSRSLIDHKGVTAISLHSDQTLTCIVSISSHAVPSNTFPSISSLKNSLRGQYLNKLHCYTPNSFTIDNLCLYLQEDLFPQQIFASKSHSADLVRWATYGTTNLLDPTPSPKAIVPNIVHYVWLGKRKLDYFTYLSFLSSLYVLEADAVYVHGEAPLGELWDYFKKEPRLKLIHRDFPDAVYGSPIQKFVSHASDYLRADILLRYGGVYADTDVIFLKRLPQELRQYPASACVDWPKTGAFPDVFNMGVLTAAPGADYLRLFLESYRWYLDTDWSYNAIHIPYKVYEKRPTSLNVERHLQVLCAEDKCHATWLKGYKADQTDHLDGHSFDWRRDALAIHWTHPDPKEFTSHHNLVSTDSIVADIGKMVLRKANIL